RAIMSVLSGITQVEQRALFNAAEQAGIGRVCMIENGLAAALGSGVKIDDTRASAIVDLGESTTSVAIVANGAMVHARTERIGSWDINAALIDHVRRHGGLAIGEQTAERLKLELASATLPDDLAQQITIKGRDILTSRPGAIEITAGEVYPVAHEVVRKIVDIISTTPGDIYDRGMILTGGGALLSGLDNYVRDQTRLSTRITDEPRYAIVRGLEQMFAEPLWLRRVMRCRPDQFLDFERDVSSLET
ncbi:MAG: hypothetical protein DME33_00060, partial [Verrucomicrobia bacterium]